VELDVSKQLFNERLIITVGGNVNMESAAATQQTSAVSNITGDFMVEYKLTENGRYRVKVFQTSDYDLLNEANQYRTGIGLTYRHSFRRLLQRQEETRKQHEKSSAN
jgi:hypothetical protein